jgi:hypothetical protein
VPPHLTMRDYEATIQPQRASQTLTARGTTVDEMVPFGLAITVTMPGVVEVYDQARARIAPPVAVPLR